MPNKKKDAYAYVVVLAILFYLLPIFTHAQVCINQSKTIIKGVTESECSGRGGNWSNKAMTGTVNCNVKGNIYQSSVSECSAFGGAVITESGDAVQFTGTPSADKPTDGFIPYFKGTSKDSSIGQYIQAIYNYAIGIVGIVAVVVIMIGGLIWITSLGNAGRVTSAKDWIGGALTGLALAMFSWSLLYIINPDLVYFKPINPKTIGAAPIVPRVADDANQQGCCLIYGEIVNQAFSSTKASCKGEFFAGFEAKDNDCEVKTTSPVVAVTGNYYNKTQGCVGGGNCRDCKNCVETNFPKQNGVSNIADANLTQKARLLFDSRTDIQQSGGWSGEHATGGNHPDGLAIDIKFTDGSIDPARTRALYKDIESRGLSTKFELPSGSCSDYGPWCRINPQATGSHFHVQL